MNDNIELFELEDRYCPICGKRVKKGSSLHKCSKASLNKINKIRKEEELKENDDDEEEERTYIDKLEEFDKFYNQETFYNNDE